MRMRTPLGHTEPIDALRGRKVVPCCGVGAPQTVFDGLRAHGADPVAAMIVRDHHAYDRADVVELTRRVLEHGAAAVVTTEKDWVKLEPLIMANVPGDPKLEIWIIEADLEVAEADLTSWLSHVLARAGMTVPERAP